MSQPISFYPVGVKTGFHVSQRPDVNFVLRNRDEYGSILSDVCAPVQPDRPEDTGRIPLLNIIFSNTLCLPVLRGDPFLTAPCLDILVPAAPAPTIATNL